MGVLICDNARRVQVGRAAGLRWYDDAGHLLSVVPLWWIPSLMAAVVQSNGSA
jgi:hypothetical protein